MWLLNTTTYELRDFLPGTVPKYAILSHCWGEGEVLFADMKQLRVAREKPGWAKVEMACQCALQTFNCAWLWDDTCCIDKSSSAELSEAINSMFAWYRDSEICIVFLHDVLDGEDPESAMSSFRNSRWFTRGWTLQELIAPSVLVFLSKSWKRLGTRPDLADTLEDVTRIPRRVLGGRRLHKGRRRLPKTVDEVMSSICVAERMSWAAGRQTTRPEDKSYSLMGLFNVNIPMLYGEGGSAAFRRLQLEIMQRSRDHTLFAWGRRMPPAPSHLKGPQLIDPALAHPILLDKRPPEVPLLAPSVDHFQTHTEWSVRNPGSLQELATALDIEEDLEGRDHAHTNAGIRMQLPLRHIRIPSRSDSGSSPRWSRKLYCAALNCYGTTGSDGQEMYGVGLVLIQVAPLVFYSAASKVIESAQDRDDMLEGRMVALPLENGILKKLATSHERTGRDERNRRKESRWEEWEKWEGWKVQTVYIRT